MDAEIIEGKQVTIITRYELYQHKGQITRILREQGYSNETVLVFGPVTGHSEVGVHDLDLLIPEPEMAPDADEIDQRQQRRQKSEGLEKSLKVIFPTRSIAVYTPETFQSMGTLSGAGTVPFQDATAEKHKKQMKSLERLMNEGEMQKEFAEQVSQVLQSCDFSAEELSGDTLSLGPDKVRGLIAISLNYVRIMGNAIEECYEDNVYVLLPPDVQTVVQCVGQYRQQLPAILQQQTETSAEPPKASEDTGTRHSQSPRLFL